MLWRVKTLQLRIQGICQGDQSEKLQDNNGAGIEAVASLQAVRDQVTGQRIKNTPLKMVVVKGEEVVMV